MDQIACQDEMIESFLEFVRAEYGEQIASECRVHIGQSLWEDIQPYELLKRAKQNSKHSGEDLLMRHQSVHFCT